MNFINTWAQGIIVAVIIATIIEMILPNSSSAKYIKTVIGIFVLFTIVSPIIDKFNSNNSSSEININTYLQSSTDETITTSMTLNNEDTIRKMYEENLKIDIKTKITQKGYTVGDISLEILNDKNYTLNKIDLKIIAKNEVNSQNGNSSSNNVTTIIENIENIKIDIGGSRKDEQTQQSEPSIISETEKRKLKEYISGVYEVNEKNIWIN